MPRRKNRDGQNGRFFEGFTRWSDGWGGKRDGAGRPKGDDPRDKVITYRLTSNEYELLKEHTVDGESVNATARRLLMEVLLSDEASTPKGAERDALSDEKKV